MNGRGGSGVFIHLTSRMVVVFISISRGAQERVFVPTRGSPTVSREMFLADNSEERVAAP